VCVGLNRSLCFTLHTPSFSLPFRFPKDVWVATGFKASEEYETSGRGAGGFRGGKDYEY